MGIHASSPLESTYDIGTSSDAPLGQFLSRPVEVYSVTFADGNQLYETFNPWRLFLSQPDVVRKLEGYRHLRARLRIRAIITGNPMSYGRYLLAYQPRHREDMHAIASRFNDAHFIQLTSMPHIFLDVADSRGGEMTLPFFNPYNFIDLTNSDDVRDMGRIHISAVLPLAASNSSTNVCTAKVFAWLEDVTLCTPTSQALGDWAECGDCEEEELQAGGTAEEREHGDAVDLPLLAPYAKSSEMASMPGADSFGMSRTLVHPPLSKYREFGAGELATTNTHEAVMRLGTDSRGELTLDSRTVGLNGIDETTISHICSKEVMFHRCDWDTDFTIGQTIVTWNVTPMQFHTDTTPAVGARSALTPQCGVGVLFDKWRGTMVYRISWVGSKFHRGRCRIMYDPIVVEANPPTNRIYSKIIDLSEERDVEIEIPWHQTAPFADVEQPVVGSNFYQVGTTIGNIPRFSNGQIRMEVVTPLTTPDPDYGQFIQVNLFQRMKDDVQFAQPSDVIRVREWSYQSTDPGEEPQGALEEEQPNDNMPEHGQVAEPPGDSIPPVFDRTSHVWYGEQISSVRTLLKRYRAVAANASGSFRIRRPNVTTTFLPIFEFVSSWYAGTRGSVRYKVVNIDRNTAVAIAHTSSWGAGGSDRGAAVNYGSVEVEVPFYSRKRFICSRAHPDFVSHRPDETDDANFVVNTPTPQAPHFHAAGEDWTAFFYVGVPLLYNND